MRRFAMTCLLVAGSVTLLWAKAVPLSSMFDLVGDVGVTYHGSPFYQHAEERRLSNQFSVNGRNVVLHTYNTTRMLQFAFDSGTAAWGRSGLSQPNFATQVNLYGVNYYGQFVSMGVGTTAQLKTTIEFYQGGNTYYLEYPQLAVKRLSSNTWMITSDPGHIGGFPGFWASSEADFGVFRRKARDSFGAVSMPIKFDVTIQ
jgi:hypothetical protein